MENYSEISHSGKVGITQHLVSRLETTVNVEFLTKVGRKIDTGDLLATVEGKAAAFDVLSPVAGEVVQFNDEVDNCA
ncbi:hypothetical protein MBLNU13_g04902t1, partial [Cladosporium sp. NU13]